LFQQGALLCTGPAGAGLRPVLDAGAVLPVSAPPAASLRARLDALWERHARLLERWPPLQALSTRSQALLFLDRMGEP
jgi:hypothetical protein